MTQDWYKARAQIRVTEVTFKFNENCFQVKGMIDFLGPTGNEHIISKDFSHSFFDFDKGVCEIKKILENKCGQDLFFEKE